MALMQDLVKDLPTNKKKREKKNVKA